MAAPSHFCGRVQYAFFPNIRFLFRWFWPNINSPWRKSALSRSSSEGSVTRRIGLFVAELARVLATLLHRVFDLSKMRCALVEEQ